MLLRGNGPDLGAYGTRFEIPSRTMLHVLDFQASERPDDTWIVVDGAERVTFAEAQRLAHRVGNALLADLGGPANVGLFMRNQIEFMPAFYGAQVRGGRTVPLNADSRGPLLQQCHQRLRVSH